MAKSDPVENPKNWQPLRLSTEVEAQIESLLNDFIAVINRKTSRDVVSAGPALYASEIMLRLMLKRLAEDDISVPEALVVLEAWGAYLGESGLSKLLGERIAN